MRQEDLSFIQDISYLVLEWRIKYGSKKVGFIEFIVHGELDLHGPVHGPERDRKYGVLDAANDLGLKEFSALVDSSNLQNTLNDQGVLTFGTGSFVIFRPATKPLLTLRALI